MMDRREFFAAAGAAVATVAVAPAVAQEHDHHGHGAMMAAPAEPRGGKLAAAALDCLRASDACLAHCLDAFAAGDTSLAICARKTDELADVCRALAKLAANNSPHLAAYAKVSLALCRDCEKECRKHEQHHATCKACAEACAACAEECAKVI